MLTKMMPRAILIALAFAPFGHAADMQVDCRLKGGSVVQLPAESCRMEGGAPVIVSVTPAATSVTEPVADNFNQATGNPRLDATRKLIIDLLSKPVGSTAASNRNPEGIERKASFDGCRLLIDENLHIQYGNAFSEWRDFKIGSAIDMRHIDRQKFGITGKVTSKGGEMSGVAVYFEEASRSAGNAISISVLRLKEAGYAKHTEHGLVPYWDTPRDDLWIADEYGYPKDSGWGSVATDKIRVLLIVNSSDDADSLKEALGEVHAMCGAQPAEATD